MTGELSMELVINKDAFKNGNTDFLNVKEQIDKNKKGFELLKDAVMPTSLMSQIKKLKP